MKHRFFAAVFTLLTLSISAQNKDIQSIWNSGTSNSGQLKKLNDLKVKAKKLTRFDTYATTWIRFQETPTGENESNLKLQVRSFETETPSDTLAIDTLYPGLIKNYRKVADTKWPLFVFSTEPFPVITIDETNEVLKSEEQKGQFVPAKAIAESAEKKIRFLLVVMQIKIRRSVNMEILGELDEFNQLWQSLNYQQQDKLVNQNYWQFKEELRRCYEHKYANKSWDCTCSTNSIHFPEIPTCRPKEIYLNPSVKEKDAPTLLLERLTDGDLSAVQEAKDKGYGTWGFVKDKLIPQLIFWHLATLDRKMIELVNKGKLGKKSSLNDQMRLSLVYLWEQGEATDGNRYERGIGLNDTMISDIQEFYHCALGVETVSANPASKKASNKPTKLETLSENTNDQSGMKTPVIKPASGSYSAKEIKGRSERVINKKNAEGMFDLAAIAPDMRDFLQDQADLHDDAFGKTCVDVIPLNKKVLEISLKGCGLKSQGVFPIMETETSATSDFYNVCGNSVFTTILEPFQKKFGGKLKITIIGTADTLTYAHNDKLAEKRAKGIKKHLGANLLNAIGGENGITIETKLNDTERRVIIRIELEYPEPSPAIK
jgi:hypothetical protein